jgi:hypothetical protein
MWLYSSFNPRVPTVSVWDSFCLVCGYDEENLFIHDIYGLGYAPVSFNNFRSAWEEGKRLCPVIPPEKVPFFFVVKEKVRSYKEWEVFKNSLKRAQGLLQGEELSPSMQTGLIGERRFCHDVKDHFSVPKGKTLSTILRLLQNVTFFLGSQGKGDIACSIRYYAPMMEDERERLLRMAQIYEEESLTYLRAVGKTRFIIENIDKEGFELEPHFYELYNLVTGIIKLDEEALETIQGLA